MHNIAEKYVKEKSMKGISTKTWLENNDRTINFYRNLGYQLSEPIFNPAENRHDILLTLTF